MVNLYYVIKQPIITKKSKSLIKFKQLSFEVCSNATKTNIKKAFNIVFKVIVQHVNTLIIRGKTKRVSKSWGKQKNIKKAVVTFKNIQDIKKMIHWGK